MYIFFSFLFYFLRERRVHFVKLTLFLPLLVGYGITDLRHHHTWQYYLYKVQMKTEIS